MILIRFIFIEDKWLCLTDENRGKHAAATVIKAWEDSRESRVEVLKRKEGKKKEISVVEYLESYRCLTPSLALPLV